RVPEVLATPSAQVPRVRMDTEPILVEVRVPAIRTQNLPHRVTEYVSRHIVNRVQLIDVQSTRRDAIAHYSNRAECIVEFLLALWRDAAMHMNTAIEWLRGRIVYGRHRTPERNPPRIRRE